MLEATVDSELYEVDAVMPCSFDLPAEDAASLMPLLSMLLDASGSADSRAGVEAAGVLPLLLGEAEGESSLEPLLPFVVPVRLPKKAATGLFERSPVVGLG